MTSSIAEQYIASYSGMKDRAMRAFATDLMRDDEANFKRGYTKENAVIATAEAFGVSRDQVEGVLA